jgi:hypothetical protein
MKKNKDIFRYNRLLKPICEKITDHKHRKLVGWDASFSNGGYKYANRHDFYFKCKVCGYVYFNNTPRKEELEYIKEWDKNNKD